MRVLGSADNTTPRFSLTTHTPDGAAGEIRDGDVVEAPVDPVDNDVLHKEVAVTSLGLQMYDRKRTRRTVSHADVVTSLLCSVSQKHEDELVKSLKLNKYQYGVCLMTVVHSVSGRLGVVEVDDLLEQQGTGLFLRKKIALAIFDGRNRRACKQKRTDSSETEPEWASPVIRIALFELTGFQSLSSH